MKNKKCAHCEKCDCENTEVKYLTVMFSKNYKRCNIELSLCNYRGFNSYISQLNKRRIHRIDNSNHAFTLLVPTGENISINLLLHHFEKFANNVLFKGRYNILSDNLSGRECTPFLYTPYNDNNLLDKYTKMMISYYKAKRALIKAFTSK